MCMCDKGTKKPSVFTEEKEKARLSRSLLSQKKKSTVIQKPEAFILDSTFWALDAVSR